MGNITLKFEDMNFDKSKDPYVLKEGSIYNFRIFFKVRSNLIFKPIIF
jgi:hypothetical protein